MKVNKNIARRIANEVLTSALKHQKEKKEEFLMVAYSKFFGSRWFGSRRTKKYMPGGNENFLEITENLIERGIIYKGDIFFHIERTFIQKTNEGVIEKAQNIINICNFLIDDEFVDFDQKTVEWLSRYNKDQQGGDNE